MTILEMIREQLVGKTVKIEKRLPIKINAIACHYGGQDSDDYLEITGSRVRDGKLAAYKLDTIPELLETTIVVED